MKSKFHGLTVCLMAVLLLLAQSASATERVEYQPLARECAGRALLEAWTHSGGRKN